MANNIFSSRELNQQADETKCLFEGNTKIADRLTMPLLEDIEFEIPEQRDLARPPDFS